MQSKSPLPESGFEVVVIGAGIVGLAIAAGLARKGRSVLVLERETGIARGITSRNSEVVHAGIYYPSESLKAQTCVEGRERLYAWCEARRVDAQRLGKLIVATRASEVPILEDLLARGRRERGRGTRADRCARGVDARARDQRGGRAAFTRDGDRRWAWAVSLAAGRGRIEGRSARVGPNRRRARAAFPWLATRRALRRGGGRADRRGLGRRCGDRHSPCPSTMPVSGESSAAARGSRARASRPRRHRSARVPRRRSPDPGRADRRGPVPRSAVSRRSACRVARVDPPATHQA